MDGTQEGRWKISGGLCSGCLRSDEAWLGAGFGICEVVILLVFLGSWRNASSAKTLKLKIQLLESTADGVQDQAHDDGDHATEDQGTARTADGKRGTKPVFQ